MTLGEFREYTKNMRDDVDLMYHHAGGYHQINTFHPIGRDALVFCYSSYMQEDYIGIIESMAMLN